MLPSSVKSASDAALTRPVCRRTMICNFDRFAAIDDAEELCRQLLASPGDRGSSTRHSEAVELLERHTLAHTDRRWSGRCAVGLRDGHCERIRRASTIFCARREPSSRDTGVAPPATVATRRILTPMSEIKDAHRRRRRPRDAVRDRSGRDRVRLTRRGAAAGGAVLSDDPRPASARRCGSGGCRAVACR